jgi:hypothetical protein
MKSLDGDLEPLARALTENETQRPADLRAVPAGPDTLVPRAVQSGAQVRTGRDFAYFHRLAMLVPYDQPAGLRKALQWVVELTAAHGRQRSAIQSSTSKVRCGLLYGRRIELTAKDRCDAAVVECRCALDVIAEPPLDQFLAGRGLPQDFQQIALCVQEGRFRGLSLG